MPADDDTASVPAVGAASFLARRLPRLPVRTFQLRRACDGAA